MEQARFVIHNCKAWTQLLVIIVRLTKPYFIQKSSK
jgi:hypothetical protein